MAGDGGHGTSSLFRDREMTTGQWRAVMIAVTLNALDGFDVVSISLAAPGIAASWGLNAIALGTILSMELVGMILGSVFLSNLADRFGRRPLVLGCVTIMAIGMLLTATAVNMTELAVWRVLTGLGIGGMVATVTTIASEFANARWRSFCVSTTVVGYSLGVGVGSLISSWLLTVYGWPSVFVFGGMWALVVIPVVLFVLPESPAFHAARGRPDSLERVNETLIRLRHAPLAELPTPPVVASGSYKALFSSEMALVTIIVSTAYMTHISTFYFITKWMPTLIVDLGFTPAEAALYVVVANVGGVLGGISYGLIARNVDARRLAAIVLFGSFLSVGLFGSVSPMSDKGLLISVILVGIFANAGVASLYTVLTGTFPDHLRATGTGLAVGLGRGAAIVAPIAAGWLILQGFPTEALTLAMGVGSLLAAILVLRRFSLVKTLNHSITID